MDRNQRFVLGIGVLLILASGLFPPYEGISAVHTRRVRMGHYFLFTPPDPNEVYQATEAVPNILPGPGERGYYTSRILVVELGVQFATILLAACGATLILRRPSALDSRRSQSEVPNEEAHASAT